MIDKSILLTCDPGDAFRLFTARVSDWWPPAHRPTHDPQSRLFLEETGRFWEQASDGREADLGRVVAWQPPHRLMLDFYLGTDAERPTAVEVTFTAEPGGTRVRVRHTPTPESKALWDTRAHVFERSWTAVLTALADR